jgi:uncharacterized membrane protein YgdD (TMEM256/DUF423 family)
MVGGCPRRAQLYAAIAGAIGVASGAFGAHALRARVTEARLETWQTGAHYLLVHAVVLLALALAGDPVPGARRLFTFGAAVFAGSLFLLVLLDLPVLGAVTPFGGLALIGGWVWLGVHASRMVSPSASPERGGSGGS